MMTDNIEPTPRMLVVEDDELLAYIAKPLFKQAGYQAIVAKTGEEALTFWQPNHDFIMAFIDLGLPDMKGSLLAQKFRASHPDIPLIAVTARVDLKHEIDNICQEFQLNDLLIKPLVPNNITDMVQKHLPKVKLAN